MVVVGARASWAGFLFALAGCSAARVPAPVEPVVSPTGITYDLGTPPVETRFSQAAGVYLNSGSPLRALELAREGIQSDPRNPVHYFLAGVAHARLGELEPADRMFRDAQRIYPAYELKVEPEREAAWVAAFNRGNEAYRSGDVIRAIEDWQNATLIYDLRPEAHRNLATVLAAEGREEEAIEVYRKALTGSSRQPATHVLSVEERRARDEHTATTEANITDLLLVMNRYAEAEPLLRKQLARDSTRIDVRMGLATALGRQGRGSEARAIYVSLLSEGGLQTVQLFNVGVALFRSAHFMDAARAFRQMTERYAYSRDAWFNYTNSLFAAQDWDALVTVGDRVIELDPLNESSSLIIARAHLERGDERTAIGGVARIKAAPVHLEELVMRTRGTETEVQGFVAGNAAESGTRVTLRFTFYGEAGPLGSEEVTVLAPPSGMREPLSVTFTMSAVAYRYELSH